MSQTEDKKLSLSETETDKKEVRDSEEEVIEAIKKARAGDESAFKKLVEKYRSQVVGVAFRMVGDYEDAKDVSQMVFIKTYQNLDRFDTSKKFSTWLYRITINASIDFLRKYKKHRHESLDESLNITKEDQADAEEIYKRGLIKWAINQSLEKLSAKQKSVFVLRDLEGLDIKMVAQILSMPQATVRWYLHRARAKLKEELTKNFPQLVERRG